MHNLHSSHLDQHGEPASQPGADAIKLSLHLVVSTVHSLLLVIDHTIVPLNIRSSAFVYDYTGGLLAQHHRQLLAHHSHLRHDEADLHASDVDHAACSRRRGQGGGQCVGYAGLCCGCGRYSRIVIAL